MRTLSVLILELFQLLKDKVEGVIDVSKTVGNVLAWAILHALCKELKWLEHIKYLVDNSPVVAAKAAGKVSDMR
jgi:hypothetical protein